MLSLVEQIMGFNAAAPLLDGRVLRPTEARLESAYEFVRSSAEPITSNMLREHMQCGQALACECLRVLHDEQSRVVRVKNGPRGAKRYVARPEG